MPDPGNDRVPVQLKVFKRVHTYPGHPSEYHVAVTGTGIQLGFDDPDKAPRCKLVGRDVWIKEIWLPRNTTISYKFLVVRSSYYSMKVVDVEDFTPRILHVYDRPVVVECHFNTKRQKITQGDGGRQSFKTTGYLRDTKRSPPTTRPTIVPDILSNVPEAAMHKTPAENVNHVGLPIPQNDNSVPPQALIPTNTEDVGDHCRGNLAEEMPSQHVQLLTTPSTSPVVELIEPMVTDEVVPKSLSEVDFTPSLPDLATAINPVVPEKDTEAKTNAVMTLCKQSMSASTKTVDSLSRTIKQLNDQQELAFNSILDLAETKDRIENRPEPPLPLTTVADTPQTESEHEVKGHKEKQLAQFLAKEKEQQLKICKDFGPLINKLEIIAEIEIKNKIKITLALRDPAKKEVQRALVIYVKSLCVKPPMVTIAKAKDAVLIKLKEVDTAKERVVSVLRTECMVTVKVTAVPRASDIATVRMMEMQSANYNSLLKMMSMPSTEKIAKVKTTAFATAEYISSQPKMTVAKTGIMVQNHRKKLEKILGTGGCVKIKSMPYPRALAIPTEDMLADQRAESSFIKFIMKLARADGIVAETVMALARADRIGNQTMMAMARTKYFAVQKAFAVPRAEDFTTLKKWTIQRAKDFATLKVLATTRAKDFTRLKELSAPRAEDFTTLKILVKPRAEYFSILQVQTVPRAQNFTALKVLAVQRREDFATLKVLAISRADEFTMLKKLTIPRAEKFSTPKIFEIPKVDEFSTHKILAIPRAKDTFFLKMMMVVRAKCISKQMMAVPRPEDFTTQKVLAIPRADKFFLPKILAISRAEDTATVKMMAVPRPEDFTIQKVLAIPRADKFFLPKILAISRAEDTATVKMMTAVRVERILRQIRDTATEKIQSLPYIPTLHRASDSFLSPKTIGAWKDYLYLKRPIVFHNAADIFIRLQQLKQSSVAEVKALIQKQIKNEPTSSSLNPDSLTITGKKHDTSALLLRNDTTGNSTGYNDSGTSVDMVGLQADDTEVSGATAGRGSILKHTKLITFVGIAAVTAGIACTYFKK